jgi:hypothetical protein
MRRLIWECDQPRRFITETSTLSSARVRCGGLRNLTSSSRHTFPGDSARAPSGSLPSSARKPAVRTRLRQRDPFSDDFEVITHRDLPIPLDDPPSYESDKFHSDLLHSPLSCFSFISPVLSSLKKLCFRPRQLRLSSRTSRRQPPFISTRHTALRTQKPTPNRPVPPPVYRLVDVSELDFSFPESSDLHWFGLPAELWSRSLQSSFEPPFPARPSNRDTQEDRRDPVPAHHISSPRTFSQLPGSTFSIPLQLPRSWIEHPSPPALQVNTEDATALPIVLDNLPKVHIRPSSQ